MNGPERRSDGDEARTTTLIPTSMSRRARREAENASDSLPMSRWLGQRSRATAYVVGVTALAIGGAAIVHDTPGHDAAPTTVAAAAAMTAPASPAPATPAMATMELQPIIIFGKPPNPDRPRPTSLQLDVRLNDDHHRDTQHGPADSE